MLRYKTTVCKYSELVHINIKNEKLYYVPAKALYPSNFEINKNDSTVVSPD